MKHMVTYQFEYKDRQPEDGANQRLAPSASEQIIVVPAQAEHTDGVLYLDNIAYDYGDAAADDPFGGDAVIHMYLNQIRAFPEGQFVAIDRATHQVVGRTASMRYHFDPTRSLLESWSASTGDG